MAPLWASTKTVVPGFDRDDHGVGRSNERRTIVDEDFAARRVQIDWYMPMNRTERLRPDGGKRGARLLVVRMSEPGSGLSGGNCG